VVAGFFRSLLAHAPRGVERQHVALLAVHADDKEWAKRAQDALKRYGAKDIDRASEASGSRAS